VRSSRRRAARVCSARAREGRQVPRRARGSPRAPLRAPAMRRSSRHSRGPRTRDPGDAVIRLQHPIAGMPRVGWRRSKICELHHSTFRNRTALRCASPLLIRVRMGLFLDGNLAKQPAIVSVRSCHEEKLVRLSVVGMSSPEVKVPYARDLNRVPRLVGQRTEESA
jgi:hypothetical protein